MRTRPWPEQSGQGSPITWPFPMQTGQVRSMVKKPWLWRILPWPLQVEQVVGLVPGLAPEPWQASQAAVLGTLMVARLP